MSDNLSRYCAIRDALLQWYPQKPHGHLACHLRTLAMLISGIVGSRKSHLPAIASKAPNLCKRESRIKRCERWLKNERIEQEIYFLPFARALLASLPPGPLVLVMDASEVGRGCLALMLNVVYQKRALPLCWSVVSACKGHRSDEEHLALVRSAQALVPAGREVIFLGDGEFDGVGLLAFLQACGWQFVCRTAKNARLREGDPQAPSFSFADLLVAPKDLIEIETAFFTKDRYGPLLAVAFWDPAHKEPLYLVSSFELGEEALFWYKRRFRIETFFSDQKSRGFYLAHSHLSDPKRIGRLLIATCLAYLWIVFLGALVQRKGWTGLVHRTNRSDLSLFQLGLIWLDYCLEEGLPIHVAFHVKSVR